MAEEYRFVDHLAEHMKGQAQRYFEDRQQEDLPPEFQRVPREILIAQVADHAAAILRKIENDAIAAAVERYAAMIRYSVKKEGK